MVSLSRSRTARYRDKAKELGLAAGVSVVSIIDCVWGFDFVASVRLGWNGKCLDSDELCPFLGGQIGGI